MQNIINHNNLNSVNTFNSNLKYGDINPLLRKSYKQLINVNSRFRKNYSTTISSKFSHILSTPIKKVVSMKVVDVIIPKTDYNISSITGSNNFKISYDSTDISNVITIPSGNYSINEIVIVINNALSSNNFNDIRLQYNDNNKKMSFNSISNTLFAIDFAYNYISSNEFTKITNNFYKDQLTLGWLLGFRKDYYNTPEFNEICNPYYCCGSYNPTIIDFSYSNSNLYIAEGFYDSEGSNYYLLSVNDYQNNHNIVLISPFQEESLAHGNLLAKIPKISTTNSLTKDHTERIYFGPTSISKLEIILYDEYGRIVDLNNMDLSFTLELEVLYDL